MSSIDPSTAVGQVVVDHPECARIFRHHHIDFCCAGDVSVASACAKKGVDATTLTRELEQAVAERSDTGSPIDARALPTPELMDFIVSRYHTLLRKSLPFAEQLANKVARVHGEHNPKLRGLAEVVVALREALEPHIDAEESTIFPLLAAPGAEGERARAHLESMRTEHAAVGELLARMQSLSDEYTVPEWGCRSYRALMHELEALEIDTLAHVHIENHVLAPRFAMGPSA